jgi:hypothetical protein
VDKFCSELLSANGLAVMRTRDLGLLVQLAVRRSTVLS